MLKLVVRLRAALLAVPLALAATFLRQQRQRRRHQWRRRER